MAHVESFPSNVSGPSGTTQVPERTREELQNQVKEKREYDDREKENRVEERSGRVNEDPAARPPDNSDEIVQEARRSTQNQNAESPDEGDPSLPEEPTTNDRGAAELQDDLEDENAEGATGFGDKILRRPEVESSEPIQAQERSIRPEVERLEGVEDGLQEATARTVQEQASENASEATGGSAKLDSSAPSTSGTNEISEPPVAGPNEAEPNQERETPPDPAAVQTQRGQNIDDLI